MKILILYTQNKSLFSSFFQELSEKLCKDGFQVFNFSLKRENNFFEQNGVGIYFEKHRGLVSNYLATYKIIKRIRPDVVISNFSYINPAILFGRLLGVKRNIAWFHTAFGHTKPNILKVWNKSIYLNMADVVLTNSKSLQNEMHEVYRVAKEKTRRIPFWTNIEDYAIEVNSLPISIHSDSINIGSPGRLLTNKNHKVVIEAVYQLKQMSNRDIRLYIAGDGTNKIQLEVLVTNLDLKNEVVFLGVLNANEMALFYKAMDVIVLPSFHEAFGLVFIEAIALGTPVIVSNTFGALSFIDNQKFPLDNFCFNPEAIQELIDKLEPYILNQGFSKTYFKHMYDESFEKEAIYEQIKAIILNQ